MAALFPTWTNTLARVVIGAVVVGALGLVAFLLLYVRSPLFTRVGEPVEQPVQFDHRHHVQDDGIDCRYCHSSVERSASAGMPPVSLCMNCHNQVWPRSELLAVVRKAFFADLPIPWRRVHQLPDFVFFHHGVHVSKGVGCVTCHGRVDEMAAVMQVAPLTMQWCLDCHRAPERHLRPVETVTRLDWEPPGDRLALGRELARRYDVEPRITCTTCHR